MPLQSGMISQHVSREILDEPRSFGDTLRGFRRATGQSQLQAALSAGIIASLQAPLDARLEDLRVELFIPADLETAEWFRRSPAAPEEPAQGATAS